MKWKEKAADKWWYWDENTSGHLSMKKVHVWCLEDMVTQCDESGQSAQATLCTPVLAFGPLKMRIKHGRLPLKHRLDSLWQQSAQLLGGTRMRSPNLTAASRLCDARVVWRRRKTNVQLFVTDFGAFAIGVNEQHGSPWCIPALVVEYNGQNGDLVPLRDPVNGPGH